MNIRTLLTELLNVTYPIIQAPMAGGGDTPELTAGVCNAGALGFIGAAYLTPDKIIEASGSVRSKTHYPFGINLFAPTPKPDKNTDLDPALARLAPYYKQLNLPEPLIPSSFAISLEDQVSTVLESGASVFSFTFGLMPPSVIQSVKSKGIFVIGTATNVREAIALEDSGVDAIVAQGSEAGGHRGTFIGDFDTSMIGTIALVPQIIDNVRIPVIASGGIMDGRGICAALALGAQAVQMGTAFLTCNEAGIADVYKEKILSTREDQTKITKAFSGRPARGIINRFMSEIDKTEPYQNIPPFPIQNALTRPLRNAAAKAGLPDFLSLWAGQALRLAHRQSASELIAKLINEINDILNKLNEFRE